MTSHPTAIDLELYVISGLSRGRAAEVEDHVAGCSPCASRLADEAALDLALEQIARGRAAPGRADTDRRARRSTLIGAAMIAAAAAFVLILGRQPATDDRAERAPAIEPPAADAGAALALDDGGDAPR